MRAVALIVVVAVALSGTGCTTVALGWAGRAFSSTGGTFASESDPELVRGATPFALKAMEALLERTPDNVELLRALAADFTEYAYAFVQSDADELEAKDFTGAQQLRARAAKLYARARNYGQRGLEARHPGLLALLATHADAAVALLSRDDVPFAYWTGLAWGAQIAVSKTDLALVAQLPQAAALMSRALAVDEAYDDGAGHDFFIVYDARSASMGGNIAHAHQHFNRALEISHGQRLAPLVAWAEAVCVQQQNVVEFKSLLERVLAFDVDSVPEVRLANMLSQRRARRLLAQRSDLFLEAE